MPLKNSNAKINYFFIITLFIFQSAHGSLQGQEQDHDHHDLNAHDAAHSEISIGTGISYLSEYQSFNPALHLHAIKGINSFLGIGAGYEMIFTEDLHQSISLMLNIQPISHLDINAGTAIGLPSHDEPWHMGLHAEASLTWPIGKILHAGPMLDFGWSKHGYHQTTGLHLGFDL